MDSMTPELATAPVALTSHDHTGEERIVVFTLERPDGTVDEFSIPKRHRPNVGLRFLWEMKTLGEQIATVNLLETAFGTEGFLALIGHDDLTVEQNERIQRMVLSYTMGDVEKGKAR
jgi:hypothetical protein